jgi:hypothetical protein
VSGIKLPAKDKAKDTKCGVTEASMKATGRKIRRTERAGSFMLMEISMTDIGRTTRLMGLEVTLIPMEPNIKVIGKMTSNTERGRSSGQTEPSTQEAISKARNMA